MLSTYQQPCSFFNEIFSSTQKCRKLQNCTSNWVNKLSLVFQFSDAFGTFDSKWHFYIKHTQNGKWSKWKWLFMEEVNNILSVEESGWVLKSEKRRLCSQIISELAPLSHYTSKVAIKFKWDAFYHESKIRLMSEKPSYGKLTFDLIVSNSVTS